ADDRDRQPPGGSGGGGRSGGGGGERGGDRARARVRSELREEAGIVLEHETDVGDVVPEHRDTLDADAEGEAGVALGIDAGVFEDDRVDHPAAEDLDPTGVLAEAAPAARAIGLRAEDAADVDLGARLDEG